MRYVLLFGIIIPLVISGCSNNEQIQEKEPILLKEKKEPFFEFNKIEHYYTHHKTDSLLKLTENRPINPNDTFLISIVFGNQFSKMDDTSKIFMIDTSIFYKKEIKDPSVIKKAKDIFREKLYDNELSSTCEPTFRDILFFKKDNKITGMAKICLDCKESVIRDSETTFRINYTEYSKLETLLFGKPYFRSFLWNDSIKPNK